MNSIGASSDAFIRFSRTRALRCVIALIDTGHSVTTILFRSLLTYFKNPRRNKGTTFFAIGGAHSPYRFCATIAKRVFPRIGR